MKSPFLKSKVISVSTPLSGHSKAMMRSQPACSLAPKIMTEKQKRTLFPQRLGERVIFYIIEIFVSQLQEDRCSIKAAQHGETLQNLSCRLQCELPTGSALREKRLQVKGSFTQATEHALFKAAYFLIKNEKAFLDGAVFKEAMMTVANTIFKDDKHGPDVISTL